MKRFVSALFLLTLAAAGCSKATDENTTHLTHVLIGKWVYTESYMGIGNGRDVWQPAQPANQTVEFNADGTFYGTVPSLKEFTRFEITDSAIVTFRSAAKPSGYKMGYNLENPYTTLILYPVEPYCICGCSDKFERRTQ